MVPPQKSTTSQNELSKAQTTFVSGSLLGWGLILLGLHSHVSSYAAATNVDIDLQAAMPSVSALNFYVLAALLGLGLSITILSVLCLIATGQGLVQDVGQSPDRYRAIAQYLYSGIFFTSKVAVGYVAILAPYYPAALIYAWLLNFGLPRPAALVAFIAVILGWLMLLVSALLHRLESWKFSQANLSHWARHRLPFIIVFVVAINLAVETSYTLSLRTQQPIISLASDRYVTFEIRLGGLTSSPEQAMLTVRSSDPANSPSDTLPILLAEPGVYRAWLPSTNLTLGAPTATSRVFTATLTYFRRPVGRRWLLWHRRDYSVRFAVVR